MAMLANYSESFSSVQNHTLKTLWRQLTKKNLVGSICFIRLPLVLARDVSFKIFFKKSENAKAERFWNYDKGIVTIIELLYGDIEGAIVEFNCQIFDQFRNVASQDNIRGWEAKSRRVQRTRYLFCASTSAKSAKPVPNPCDYGSNPWPTIVLEVASFEILEHVKNKINNFWLGPNRCEDVIVIKLVLSQTSAPGVAIDLYEIQQAIFDAMGKN
ncbi:34281_t:CDS:2 [Gigaspora margarita]|uniref:34281_t:CDS:1 n=1 Tax=Gigaspora margarita TaxID=4874 RepID=A0ABM8W669_GIGMA|nr:34281_t:CDS:2 [Gigaspora margarita]